MTGKFTKIPNTLHLSIHSVDLKQNVSGFFDIHWARGDHKGSTDKVACSSDFTIPFEANFEIPCTIFIEKDYQSIRSKLLKITLKRYQEQKLPKIYGKLTLDLAKYYAREIELQAKDRHNTVEPIQESIEMETGRAVAPVITVTFTFVQNGSVDVTEVDQNDISFAGDTKDKMKTGLDEWDVTEVHSETSSAKHSKTKKKHGSNADKDADDLDDSKSKKKHKKSKKKKDTNESETKLDTTNETEQQKEPIQSADDKIDKPILEFDSKSVITFERESKSSNNSLPTETKGESAQAANESQQSIESNQADNSTAVQNEQANQAQANDSNQIQSSESHPINEGETNVSKDFVERNAQVNLDSEDNTDDQLVADSGNDQPTSPKSRSKKHRKSKSKRRSTSSNPDLLLDSKSSLADDQSEPQSPQGPQGIIFQRETPNYNELIKQILQRTWTQSKKPCYMDNSKQVIYPPCIFPFYSTLLFSRSLFANAEGDNNQNLELLDHFVSCYENSNLVENLTINQNLLTPLCLVLLAERQKGIELLHFNGKFEDNSKYFSVKMNPLVEKGIDMFLSPILHKFDPLINRFITAKFEMDCLLVDFKQVYKNIQKYFVFTSGINRMLMLMFLEKLELKISSKLISQPSRFLFSNAILWNSFISAFISDERIEMETLREIVSVLIMANGISEDPTMKNEIAPHIEPKIVLFIMKHYRPDVMMPQIIKTTKFIETFFSNSEIDQQELNETINESAPSIEEALKIDKYIEIAPEGINFDDWNHTEVSNIMNNLYPWMKDFISLD